METAPTTGSKGGIASTAPACSMAAVPEEEAV
jgi:hypothetical protein